MLTAQLLFLISSEDYFDLTENRSVSQDTGVSVRKRMIKIMKDICVECPDFPKIPRSV